MNRPSHPPSRQGAALVIALVILAALLLLGLPFLFSQSASVAGARAAAHAAAAERSQRSIEAFGISVAAQVAARQLTPQFDNAGNPLPNPAYTAFVGDPAAGTPIPSDVGAVIPLATGDVIGQRTDSAAGVKAEPGRVAIVFKDTNGDPAEGTSLILEDEQGKLDPNYLSAKAWDELLKSLGIWDIPSELRWEWIYPATNRTPGSLGHWAPVPNGIGQLATGLSEIRLQNACRTTGRRIIALEQLLAAKPQRLEIIPADNDGVNVAADVPPPTGIALLRDPMRRAELERLRPFLTLHLRTQARQGLVPLGTVVAVTASNPPTYNWPKVTLDTALGSQVLANWSWLTFVEEPSILVRADGVGQTFVLSDQGDKVRTLLFSDIQVGWTLALDVAPPLNINAAAATTLKALGITVTQPAPYVFTSLADLYGTNHNLLPWLNPIGSRTVDYPIALTSDGVVTVETAAAVPDRAGNIQATRARRVVAQAVPQEDPITVAWPDQARLAALHQARQGSQLDTWPNPWRRVAVDGSESRTLPAVWQEPDPQPTDHGIRPIVLPGPASIATVANTLPVEWKVPLVAGGALTWTSLATATAGDTSTKDAADATWQTAFVDPARSASVFDYLTPDGFWLNRAGDSRRLAFQLGEPNSPDDGPLTAQTNDGELEPRHLGFWLRLPQAYTGANDLILAEARAPVANLGAQVDGTAGNGDNQHLWRLAYRPDGGNGWLILRLANPSIEHTSPSGIRCPPDDPATWDVDERCLGSTASGADELAPPDPATAAEVRYFVAGGLLPDRWYQVQVAVTSERPGGAAIILDGIVGRDILLAGIAPAQTGDHFPFPALVLDQDIPATDASTDGRSALELPSISLRPPSGLALTDILPSHGLIRIDDEWMRYEAIIGNTVTGVVATRPGVVRARRINTNQASATVALNWPVTQAHYTGTLALPGGMRYQSTTGQFYRGATTLSFALDNGHDAQGYAKPTPSGGASGAYAVPDALGSEPNPSSNRWRTWGWIDTASLPNGSVAENRRYGGLSGTLTVDTGLFGNFPPRGLIRCQRVNNGALVSDGEVYYWYDNGVSSPTTGFTLVAQESGSATEELVAANDALLVVLVSIAINDDISSNTSFPADGAIQVSDPGRGIEWIRYELKKKDLFAASDRWYFIHRQGFPFLNANPIGNISTNGNTRGIQRTIFGGDPVRNLADPATLVGGFPAGSTVLPVQSNNLGSSDNFETGDVVTILPSDTAIQAGKRPVQLIVRYAAGDGFPDAPPAAARWDTSNEWFAFDRKVPTEVADPTVDFLVGRGWNGDDLSTVGRSSRNRGQLPRLNAWKTGFTTDDARLVIAAPDGVRSGTGASTEVEIDGLFAGQLMNGTSANGTAGCGVLAFHENCLADLSGGNPAGASATSSSEISAAIAALPVVVELSVNALPSPNPDADRLGLVLIDGEVFAWFRPSGAAANRVKLIARGLLGSTPAEHRLPPTTTVAGGAIISAQLPLLPLPYGPVARLKTIPGVGGAPPTGLPLASGVPVDREGSFSLDQAPAFLVCAADGSGNEIAGFRAVGSTTQLVADEPVRGLYGTPPTAVDAIIGRGNESLPPILIGWWPRYPSALPSDTSRDSKALLASRRYAWAGFPLRYRGAGFEGLEPVAKITVDKDSDIFSLEMRALQTGSDWTQAGTASLPDFAPAVNEIPDDPFTGSSFIAGSDDGVEMRVYWRYTPPDLTLPPLERLARNANSVPPMLRDVELRCRAPVQVLAVEGAR